MTNNFNISISALDPLAPLLKEKGVNIKAREKIDKEVQELYAKIRALEENKKEFSIAARDIDGRIWAKKEEIRTAQAEEEKRRATLQEEDFFKTIADEVHKVAGSIERYNDIHQYQIEDIVQALAAYKKGMGGLLNANDVGMGKTMEAAFILYMLQHYMEKKPKVLWLSKKSLIEQGSTRKELLKWVPDLKIVSPITNDPRQRNFMLDFFWDGDFDIFLTNYEFVRTTPASQNLNWDIVVIDEVHKLKGGANSNGPTAIFTACKDLCKKAQYKLLLSGTPMVNAPEEMWSYLHIFDPQRFPDLRSFRNHFMQYKEVAGEMKLEVDPNKIMQNALKGRMIRRSAKEVGLQLPDITEQTVSLSMGPAQRAVYDQMLKNFYVWLESMGDKKITATAVIAQLTRLRQINVWPAGVKLKDEEGRVTTVLDVREGSKIDETMDIIENVQDQVVIFSTFNEPMDEIKLRCFKAGLTCEIINGTVKHDYDVEAAFQQGKIDILCINSTMGEGLNLQKNPKQWPGGACYGIGLDRWWSPARNNQCIGRIKRQGSDAPGFFYWLENEESVDALILAINEDKEQKFNSIMERDEIRPAASWKAYIKELLG